MWSASIWKEGPPDHFKLDACSSSWESPLVEKPRSSTTSDFSHSTHHFHQLEWSEGRGGSPLANLLPPIPYRGMEGEEGLRRPRVEGEEGLRRKEEGGGEDHHESAGRGGEVQGRGGCRDEEGGGGGGRRRESIGAGARRQGDRFGRRNGGCEGARTFATGGGGAHFNQARAEHHHLHWVNAPPPTHPANFRSPLTSHDQRIAHALAGTFFHAHPVSIVTISPSVLQHRSLGAIVGMTPEVAHHYTRVTNHQSRVIVLVEEGIDYQTPRREGNLRIKRAGSSTWSPHMLFVNEEEANKFAHFGTATLAIVVKRNGAIRGEEALLMSLGRAVSTQRLDRLLIVTSEKTSREDWRRAYELFGMSGVTAGYREIY